MENVLQVYHREVLEDEVLVCLDESNKQLMGSLRDSVPPAPGRNAKQDCDFVAGKKLNFFMVLAPQIGWRTVKVTERRCAVDWAEVIEELLTVHFPEKRKIILLQDNLNTHNASSLYRRFAPEKGRQLLDRLELHYTPLHGSWLNMAEIELSALKRQCLQDRIATREEMQRKIGAWQASRNEERTKINWLFTVEDARRKLARIYPTVLV